MWRNVAYFEEGTQACSNHHPAEPREPGSCEGRKQPTAKDLDGRDAGQDARWAQWKETKQTSCSDETLGVTMFPFSQLSPDICRETLAVGLWGETSELGIGEWELNWEQMRIAK